MSESFDGLIEYLESDRGGSDRTSIEACTNEDELYKTMDRIGNDYGYVATRSEIDGWIEQRMAERAPVDGGFLTAEDLRDVSGGDITGGDKESQPPWTGGSDIPQHCPSPCFPERTENIYCKIAATITLSC